MKINDKEINLKITPTAILKVEEMYSDFDVLNLIREAIEGKEPRYSDLCKVIYAGYLGATKEDVAYDDFLKLIEDVDLFEISKQGIELLSKRKN